MVTSLDGAASGPDGVSGSIHGPADHRVFEVLRAVADVVLVGAGTVRAEGYRRVAVGPALRPGRAARGQAADLVLAVVSSSGNLPDAVLDAPRAPLLLTTADGARRGGLVQRLGAERVVVAGADEVDPERALDALAERGLVRVLAEGGPRLLGALLAQDRVDELCLTTSPLLVGAGPGRMVDGHGSAMARPARLVHLLHARGELLARWVLDAQPGSPVRR